ncbi:amidase [Spirillospora sp. NPDC047279]|uniref:amidase n=1 Tax=Spirillospora sp. NPDC047279 TaxID=3155478 RepID=UPI0033BFFF61
METHEYAGHDGVGLRDLIRSGEVSAAEVETAARHALQQVNADVNGLTRPPFDPALSHDPDGPFGGVPFLIKDSQPFARNVPFAIGSRAIRGAVAWVDHELMARFRAAGLVTIGQTTSPEMALSFATESVRFGITRNPWALDRGVGGSSGGSAALVAAGAAPMAHANDGAGSTRVPASCCGLVGLKPSRGRVPCGPLIGEAAFGQSYEFAVTRTVRDTAHLLDAVGAPPLGEKYAAPPPSRPYAAELGARPERLRVAFTTTPWSGVPVDPQVTAAALNAAKTLEWIGHTVTEASPPIDADAVIEAMMLGALAAGAALLRAPRRPDPDLLEAVTRLLTGETEAATLLDVMAMTDAQHQVTRAAALFFTDHDLLVTPTLGQLPPPHGTLDYDSPRHASFRGWLRHIFTYGPFTAPFNVSGNPAISLPLGQSREGLPIGVQLVAAPAREDLLLRVAAQLEQALPWHDRRPPIYAGLP